MLRSELLQARGTLGAIDGGDAVPLRDQVRDEL